MNQLRRPRRGAAGEIAAIDKQRLQPALARRMKHGGTRDAATDDQQVVVRVDLHAANNLPGFIIPVGSSSRAEARSKAMPSSPFSAASQGMWSVPTPCWWLIVPPPATTACDAAVLIPSQRARLASGSAASR